MGYSGALLRDKTSFRVAFEEIKEIPWRKVLLKKFIVNSLFKSIKIDQNRSLVIFVYKAGVRNYTIKHQTILLNILSHK